MIPSVSNPDPEKNIYRNHNITPSLQWPKVALYRRGGGHPELGRGGNFLGRRGRGAASQFFLGGSRGRESIFAEGPRPC